MKHKTFICLSFFLVVLLFACRKNNTTISQEETQTDEQAAARISGAIQVSGLGFYDIEDGCNSAEQGASFALSMTGDFEGCLYVFIDEYECSPGGTYREEGRELFRGTYNGQIGTFWTTYKFEAKYEGCSVNGSPLGAEILGRCQHPIVEGSGTGVFLGVTGRLDFKDDIEAGNFPYKGHLRF